MGRVAGLSAEEARARLLAAAAEVFAERGYEGARTSEIARRAGLSTGAIYSRYETKAELLAAAINAHLPAEMAKLFGAVSGDSVAGTIRELAVQLPHRPVAISALMVEAAAACRRDPQVAAGFTAQVGAHLDALEAVITLAQRDGAADPALSARALARLCMAIVWGTLLMNSVELPGYPGDDPWAEVIDRIILACGPPA
jgi:AcrR family transcriptional regulator